MSLITRYSVALVPVVLLALVLRGRFSSLEAQAGKIESWRRG